MCVKIGFIYKIVLEQQHVCKNCGKTQKFYVKRLLHSYTKISDGIFNYTTYYKVRYIK